MRIHLFVIGICLSLMAAAQTLDEAREWFRSGDYARALPVFQRECLKKPKDHSLNYWYGTCLYQIGHKQEAVAYLLQAEKGRLREASYYLANCAYERYDYAQCLHHLDKYILYKTGRHEAEIAWLIKACERAEKLLESVEDVVFIDSFVVHSDQVFEHIRLHPSCGTIARWEQFLPHQSNDSLLGYAYRTEKGDRIFLSDSTHRNGRDLLVFHKLLDGWEKENIDTNINTLGNECHPYLLSDGVTLYFASDHNSIGGYDLFVSRYNPVMESYYLPEPLPMPFNSPANDYFCLIDEQVGRGYLVSDRRQAKDSLIVYVFLPNESRRLLRNLSRETLVSRAEIRSIADSWGGLNVDSILSAHRRIYDGLEVVASDTDPLVVDKRVEESFLIHDSLIYHSANDFRSIQAKAKYREFLALQSSFQLIQQRILDERKGFLALPEETRAERADRILIMEWEALGLEKKLQSLEYTIRALELDYLQNN